MDILKKIWPVAFKERKEVSEFVISLVVQAVILLLAGAVIGLVCWLITSLLWWTGILCGLIVWALGIVGTVFEIYMVANIVFTILSYCKVLK